MNARSPVALIFLAVASVGIVACAPIDSPQQPSAQVLSQLEVARTHAGLRPVSPDWEVEAIGNSTVRWFYPRESGRDVAKVAMYNNNGPICEEDYYYTGRTFPAPDGDGDTPPEQLTVHYDYKTHLCSVEPITDDPTVQAMVSKQLFHYGLPLNQAMPVAQAIMRKWGTNGPAPLKQSPP
jgi:hypothetical protein